MSAICRSACIPCPTYAGWLRITKPNTNNLSGAAVQQSHITVQVPYVSLDGKWTILALDLAALLGPVTKAAFEEVKRIQFCASMAVRGAFTADSAYSWKVTRPYLLVHT